jgi:hypothetical protein
VEPDAGWQCHGHRQPSASTTIGGVSKSWGYVAGNRTTWSQWERPNGDFMDCIKIAGVWHVTITEGGVATNYTLD